MYSDLLRASLQNKDKHQTIGMQFAHNDCEHNDATSLAFRKLDACAPDEVAELAQQACDETFGVEFHDMFSYSVQDLAASAVAKELQVDEVACSMHQGDKVGASAIGELVRTVNKVNLLIICIVVVPQCFDFNLTQFL